MHKYIFIITLIFFIFVFIRVKADDDDDDDDNGSSRSEYRDSKSTVKTDISSNTGDGQIQQSANDYRNNNSNNSSTTSDVNNNRDQARNNDLNNSNYGSYNQNNNRYSDTNRTNNNSYSNGNSVNNSVIMQRPQPRPTNQPPWPSAPPPVSNDVDPNMKDFRTGLSFRTLKILSKLSNCEQHTLLNYRRLLRTPEIRLQFYRDLYQLRQRNYVDGCGEGMVRIGHRERAILLSDPYFRKKIERLMSRQPIGAAIRGPIQYPNDIGAGQQQGARVLTLSKQY